MSIIFFFPFLSLLYDLILLNYMIFPVLVFATSNKLLPLLFFYYWLPLLLACPDFTIFDFQLLTARKSMSSHYLPSLFHISCEHFAYTLIRVVSSLLSPTAPPCLSQSFYCIHVMPANISSVTCSPVILWELLGGSSRRLHGDDSLHILTVLCCC